MIKFLKRYSLYITTAVGLAVLVYLITYWTELQVMNRLVCLIYIFVTVHEWEEKLFGFEELNAGNLGISSDKIKDGIGYIALFFLTLYIGIVPLFFSNVVWMTATAMVLGIIELFAHISAIRMNKTKRGYTAGMATAFTVLPATAIYGFYYLISNNLMSPIEWIFAFLNLFIPLITLQYLSVKSMGVNYKEFLQNAANSMKRK